MVTLLRDGESSFNRNLVKTKNLNYEQDKLKLKREHITPPVKTFNKCKRNDFLMMKVCKSTGKRGPFPSKS